MNKPAPFLILKKDCREAIDWFSRQLDPAGLRVVKTFDFQTARAIHTDCPCPQHGTDRCDCQMVVLLVYEAGYPPASISVHGRDGITWFLLVSSSQKTTGAQYEARIQDMLAPSTEILMPELWNRAA